MTPVKEHTAGLYVVMAAWHCETCDVAGRSPAEGEIACWNCNGKVVVTAQPSIRVDDL
jgi:DNA-directed RNA polymerase subunit RPC12/RpoP